MASSQSDIDAAAHGERDEVTVDGVRASRVERPESVADLSDVLKSAQDAGHGVVPFGGGTKLALGNVPARFDLALGTSHLNRVLHYEPTDLTLSVEAGMRFGDVQAVLGERGQALPLETPNDDRATIGGLIATALAGPRRLGSGTLRDLLIGISVAYPSGIVGKAGGLVVKNVTGFDLMRLQLGALGTLGVIVSANFKVLPHTRTESTYVTAAGTRAEAFEAVRCGRAARVKPIAAEVFEQDGAWRAAIRIEGRTETVSIGAAALASAIPDGERIDAAESAAWWRAYVGAQSLVTETDSVLVRCGTTPRESERMTDSVAGAVARHDISPKLWNVSPGLGTATIRFDPATATSLAALQAELSAVAETVTVLAAPPALKRDIDVWGTTPSTIATMRALKAEFDPTSTLNPGRFVDRI